MLTLYIICSLIAYLLFFNDFSKKFDTPASKKILELLHLKLKQLVSNRVNTNISNDLEKLDIFLKKLFIVILIISFIFSFVGFKSTFLAYLFIILLVLNNVVRMRHPQKSILENLKASAFIILAPLAFYFLIKYGNFSIHVDFYWCLLASLTMLVVSALSIVLMAIIEGMLLLMLIGLIWLSINSFKFYKVIPNNYKKNLYYLTIIFTTLTLIFLGCNAGEKNQDFIIIQQQKKIKNLEQQLNEYQKCIDIRMKSQ